MNLDSNEVDALHGRFGQESNLHLLKDAGFLARETDHASLQNIPQVQKESKYLENFPTFDETSSVIIAKPNTPPSWIEARTGDDEQLDCVGEVKGFGVKLFGFTILRSLEYQRSRLCDARQYVDATCELADLKGRKLSAAGTLQERKQAGQSVLKSTQLCIDSMQVATAELQESMLKGKSMDADKRFSSKDPRCSSNMEGFVRNILRCDI